MPDNSKFWRELDPSTQNYCLETDIKKAEKKMKEAKELQEERLEEIFDRENMARLKAMNVKDMTFADVEIFNEIKKKYSNTNKAYDGSSLSDLPQAEGSVPDTASLKSKIISTANELVSLIRNRGVTVQPIPEGASLQNILAFTHAFRDALKNSQYPEDVSGIEEPDDQPIKYSRQELLETKSTIEKMIKKLDSR